MSKLFLISLITLIILITYIKAFSPLPCGTNIDGEGESCGEMCCNEGYCVPKEIPKPKADLYFVLDKTYKMKELFYEIDDILYNTIDVFSIYGEIYLNFFNNEKVASTSGMCIGGYDAEDISINDGDFDIYFGEYDDESFNSEANNIPMEKAFKNGCDYLINHSKKKEKVLLFINSGFPYYSEAVTNGDKSKWTTEIMKNMGNIATECKNKGVEIYTINLNNRGDANKTLNTSNGKITINVNNNSIDYSLSNEFMQVLSSNYKITSITNTNTKIEYTVNEVNSNYYIDKNELKSNKWSVNKFINLSNRFDYSKNESCYVEKGCNPEFGFCYGNYSTNGKCGPNDGKCLPGQCCSKDGKCGTKASYCSRQKGCQSNYGKCKNIVIVTKKVVVKKVVTKKK